MSQCFKLVNGGFVDKVIVFDELPKRLLNGVRTREVAGFPRAWAKWLGSIGSVRDVLKTETKKIGPGDYEFTHTKIGSEPCFFLLEYTDINSDKDAWRHICEYLRMNVADNVRLKEKIEDMAIALAPDSKSTLDLEPEDVPVIPVPDDTPIDHASDDIVKPGETVVIQEKKKPGRPRKVTVGV